MKIFSATQIKAWDTYTMQHEPIDSIDLMERASEAFVKVFCTYFTPDKQVNIFCGMGNNGGDGLAVARLLSQRGFQVKTVVICHAEQGSSDFQTNFERVKDTLKPVLVTQAEEIHTHLPQKESEIMVDAVFGAGLNRPLSGWVAEVVHLLNQSEVIKVAIDIASGLYADAASVLDCVLKVDYTISFQTPKLAFFIPENAPYVGEWLVVDIGLHPDYELNTKSNYETLDASLARQIHRPRPRFAHKGSFGHALLLVGAYGSMGAGILASKAALRAGTGLLTAHVPNCGYDIMQMAVPEAMLSIDSKSKLISQFPDLKNKKYTAIGLGCGIGQGKATEQMLKSMLEKAQQPLVLDADALNLIAELPSKYKSLIPEKSILTPHLKEFSRLVGASENHFEHLEVLQNFAEVYQVYVLLKGAHSAIATPEGKLYFNTTGNPGMATAGSGDVLTGIITALLAQGYCSKDALLLGVYLHGKSGDLAAKDKGQEALIASDLIEYLGKAFLSIQA